MPSLYNEQRRSKSSDFNEPEIRDNTQLVKKVQDSIISPTDRLVRVEIDVSSDALFEKLCH